jgi:D-amino-acid oxidase
VEWQDRYYLSDTAPDAARGEGGAPGALSFATYGDRVRDINPAPVLLPAGSTPFPAKYVRRFSSMTFNIADYGHTLMTDFLLAGGRVERREFHSPSELASLALWNDQSIVPVRGQIGWLIPQPEVNYGVVFDGVNVVPRRDGIVLQMLEGGDMRGYADDNETPDRAEALEAVKRVAALYARFGKPAAA